jgi:hypothetical protein
MRPAHRDLTEPEHWERSLARSRLRRALAPRLRREHKRRKSLSAAAAAATMAGPATPMAMAQLAGGGDVAAQVASETPSARAIEVREGGLPLMYGSQGELVAHVQKALGISADGVFGAQTDTAVRQYQARAGLQVDGIVGPATWGSLFGAGSVGASNVSPHVVERIEQRLVTAGRQIDAQAGIARPAPLIESSNTDSAGVSSNTDSAGVEVSAASAADDTVRTSAPAETDAPSETGDPSERSAPSAPRERDERSGRTGGDADESPAASRAPNR